jgi:hypothetical protein
VRSRPPIQGIPDIFCPATGTPFAGTRGWVCRMFISVPVESIPQGNTFFIYLSLTYFAHVAWHMRHSLIIMWH